MAIDYSRLTSDASPVEILTAASKLKTKKDKIESKLSNEQLIIKLKMLKKELGFD